jgi:hypothetical protein
MFLIVILNNTPLCVGFCPKLFSYKYQNIIMLCLLKIMQVFFFLLSFTYKRAREDEVAVRLLKNNWKDLFPFGWFLSFHVLPVAVTVCSSVFCPQGLLDTFDPGNLFPSFWSDAYLFGTGNCSCFYLMVAGQGIRVMHPLTWVFDKSSRSPFSGVVLQEIL